MKVMLNTWTQLLPHAYIFHTQRYTGYVNKFRNQADNKYLFYVDSLKSEDIECVRQCQHHSPNHRHTGIDESVNFEQKNGFIIPTLIYCDLIYFNFSEIHNGIARVEANDFVFRTHLLKQKSSIRVVSKTSYPKVTIKSKQN